MSQFTPSGSAPLSSVGIQGAQAPYVLNIAAPTANTEVTVTIPANAKKYILKPRYTARLQVAYVSGESGTNFFTVDPHCFYSESTLTVPPTGLDLYIQSSVASQVLELIYWT